ncbi:hypothetical protein [Halalkalibacter alkalisediminis]|uniref:Aminodeoxychorismate lyase n=1 Tax=Halalkalibacter alkalisediminis TaxID=935616 RepID=A0ABV6ND65_9BACI|nr:hypothetical protein [Halalkalibacter alkalisediminis]
MRSNGLQTFAGGLFLATAVLEATFYLNQNDTSFEAEKEPLTIKEMKVKMVNHGLAVLPEEELRSLREDQIPENQDTQVEELQNTVYILFLEIHSGMSSYDIADRLVSGHIIQDRNQFLHTVEQLGLSTSLKIGLYELSSDMSIEEIIQTIS